VLKPDIASAPQVLSIYKKLEKEGLFKIDSVSEQWEDGRYVIEGKSTGILPKNDITPQQKQQALQAYSQYLDTIFPDSKVKDIVYHKTPFSFDKFEKPLEERKLNKLNKSDAIFFNFENKGFFRSKEGAKTISVIVNTTNNKITNENIPYATGSKESIKNLLQEDFDSITVNKTGGKRELLVFEPEQIHILGSKQDIEGFKEFVDNSNLDNEETSFNIDLTKTPPAPYVPSELNQLAKIGRMFNMNRDGFMDNAVGIEQIRKAVNNNPRLKGIFEVAQARPGIDRAGNEMRRNAYFTRNGRKFNPNSVESEKILQEEKVREIAYQRYTLEKQKEEAKNKELLEKLKSPKNGIQLTIIFDDELKDFKDRNNLC
jgi:hypothetical protein